MVSRLCIAILGILWSLSPNGGLPVEPATEPVVKREDTESDTSLDTSPGSPQFDQPASSRGRGARTRDRASRRAGGNNSGHGVSSACPYASHQVRGSRGPRRDQGRGLSSTNSSPLGPRIPRGLDAEGATIVVVETVAVVMIGGGETGDNNSKWVRLCWEGD